MDKTTIAINCEAAPSGFALINEDDFNPDNDTRFGVEPKRTKTTRVKKDGLGTNITDKDSDSALL